MNQLELQGKNIDALKSFNNTIVTSRLYPPEAPQVATAVDRGYKGIKNYLRLHGNLNISRRDGALFLCEQMLEQEVLDLFPNLVVYRQLRLLGLSRLVIKSEMDRFAFGQLLTVFNASVEKIKREGGGLEYITSLGLASYFPDEAESFDELQETEDVQELEPKKFVKIRPEMVACLFGKDKRPVIESELQQKMAVTGTAVDILAAGVANILQDILKQKKIISSEYFPLMLTKAERLLDADNLSEAALGLAKVLGQQLKEPALCVLMVQEYPAGFGSIIYDELVEALTTDKLAGIMVLFREQLAKARRSRGTRSSQVQFLGKAMKRLMDSEKGKKFLSAEKARIIIHEGEKERKKSRLEAGIKGLLQGNSGLLKSDELVEYLPEAVRQIKQSPDGTDSSIIINGMIAYLRDGEAEKRESLLKSMVTIGEDFLTACNWSQVDLILKPLKKEVRKGGFGDDLMKDIVTLFQQMMQKSWQEGENDRGDAILSLLYQIRSGQIPLSVAVKNIVAKAQDKGIKRASLPKLLDQCLAAPKDEILSYRLILQGPVALRFLVESLINTNDAPHRLKIIDLLTYSPHFLPSVVHERLQEHMPWYGKRNLIKLLGETGKEEDAESILPYLRHEDFRVQREAFLALYKIGGRDRKQLFLSALKVSSDSMKIQIVRALTGFCDAEVAVELVELLASHEQFDEEFSNDLLLQLLETLGRCPFPPAQKGVSAFLQTRGQRSTRKISEQVWAAAEKSSKFLQRELQEIRRKHVQASQLRKNALKQAAKMNRSGIAHRVITGAPQEQTVRTLLSRGDKEAALDQLLELIERTARLRNYSQAEKLREWLIEIDSTALNHLVRAAEIISREKIESIEKSNLEIWNELYDILTTDEFSTVYHALQHKSYENGEIVISQGVLQGSLFFINSGKVKLYFEDQGNEVIINTMEPGRIFGGGAFFEPSVWTISVAAVGTAEISVLNLETMEGWAEEFPELEAKLQSFCKKFEKVEDFIKRSANDRRKHKRYRIAGTVTTTLLDIRGKSVGTGFKVELQDVSEGGLSCLIRLSQDDNGRLLLGRKMQCVLTNDVRSNKNIVLVGDILAVKKTYGVEKAYSLHIKFDNLIDRQHLHDVLVVMREEPQVSR